MTLNKANDELKELIEKYRLIFADIAEHGNDAKYQAFNYRTQYTRSNINGTMGEFEQELMPILNHRLTQFAEEISSKSKPVLYVASVERKTVYSEKPDNAVPLEAVTATLKEFVKGE